MQRICRCLLVVLCAVLLNLSFSAASSVCLLRPPVQVVNLLAESEAKAASRRKALLWIPDGMKNAIASGLASVIVRTLLQPFDTIKTVQQMHPHPLSVAQTAKMIVATRGVRDLWSGVLVTALGSAPSVAVYFGVFSSTKKRLATLLPPDQRFLAVGMASMMANSLAAVLRVPYEVYKQRLQAGFGKSTAEVVLASWRSEGLRGLFSGGKLVSQIARDVPYALVTAVSYDLLQHLLHSHRIATNSSSTPPRLAHKHEVGDAICGAVAGGLGSFVTTPLDVIKTRLMLASPGLSTSSPAFRSFGEAFRGINAESGLGGFFAGTTPRVLQKVPANGLFFLFYESLRYFLGAVERRSEQ
eukprot:gene6071-6685_t